MTTVHKREDMLPHDFTNLALKESSSTQTGLSYDERMTEHRCLWDPNYPEKPERLSFPLQRCREYGLVDRCTFIPCRPATEEELLTQHSRNLIEIVKQTRSMGNVEVLEELSSKYDAIYFHPSTYDLSLLSVGSTIDLATLVATGKLKNAMGIIRPPGHHAMNDEACGYCYFNNVAIATKHVIDNLGLSRVLIVDWDVHHGQASQYMFYDDPRVLYFSIHRYENGEFWPNLRASNYDYVGSNNGKGFNINVPLNQTGMGNSEYMAIFHQLLLPVAYEFAPELVIVSAGYDAAIGCFEGCMEVTPAGYSHLLSSLMGLAEGRLCVILEGGYCLKSLSEGVALTLRTLLGDPCPRIEPLMEPCQAIVDTILDVISVHRPFWKCFQYQGPFHIGEELVDSNEVTKLTRNPQVIFKGVDDSDRPKTFATRDCYPLQSAELINSLDRRIDELICKTDLSVPPNRTCIAYDHRMLLHKNNDDPGHPERPDRISRIRSKLEELRILQRCHIVQSRNATQEELALLHRRKYISAMRATEHTKPRDLFKLQESFQSIYLCQDTYRSALIAAGSLFQVLDQVVTGQAQNGVALIRPPGHHAEVGEACGFCIFNNVALAAQLAITRYGLTRVLIVDWDVHHGNGIQHMFEHEPRVLYISLHRYDKGSFFPCSEDANFDKVGTGEGAGYNINIPWNKSGMGDGDYISAFHHIILPVAYQFEPELVLVSAGFDAAKGDPLGGCRVTPEGYGHMTQLLASLANGRIILALEGGYNLTVLTQSVVTCTKVLLGDPCPALETGISPCLNAVTSILNTLKAHKLFWSCLKYQVDLPVSTESQQLKKGNSSVNCSQHGTDSLSLLNGDLSMDSLAASMGDLHINSELRPDLQKLEEEELVGATAAEKDPLHVFNIMFSMAGESSDNSVMYAVVPLPWCPHVESVQSLPPSGFDITAVCKECHIAEENWICLVCYEVCCGRHKNQHMIMHNSSTGHNLALSFSDFSVWCFGCDSYISNEAFNPALELAHMQKFGMPMPSMGLKV